MPLFSGSNGITSALPISEANVSNLVADLDGKVAVAGDTMTGQLAVHPAALTGRALEIALPALADTSASSLLNAYDGDGNYGIDVTGVGSISLNAKGDTNDVLYFTSGALFTLVLRMLPTGALILGGITAPADGDLAASQLGVYFDDTNGASKVRFKGKSADGTVVTGVVNLT